MNEEKKITEAELAEIKMLQTKFQDGILKFGTLHAEKLNLDRINAEFKDKEKRLNDEWESLQKLEQGLLDKIIKNYGEGNLSIETGIFTPTQK